jgi:dTDP-glucose 4,6-dehydratase
MWLLTILLKGVHGRPYNVGSAEAISIYDLACLVRACTEIHNPVKVLGAPVPGTLPFRYIPSVERAASELGLHPRYSLEEAIRRTWAWFLKNRK